MNSGRGSAQAFSVRCRMIGLVRFAALHKLIAGSNKSDGSSKRVVMNRRNFLRASASLSAALASASLFPATAFAQYPERPIRLIVPRTPGGVVDLIGREWAARVQNSVGTVVVENMGGGGGTIGAATAARAPADG